MEIKEESRVRGVLIVLAPMLVVFFGGLIMYIGGYRGYELTTTNPWQMTGVVISSFGGGWFIGEIAMGFITWFRKPKPPTT